MTWFDLPHVIDDEEDYWVLCSDGDRRRLTTKLCASGYATLGGPMEPKTTLPTDSAARKAVPLCSGVLDYFPAALAEVAKVSHAGNEKHNPGQPLHWARGKSSDHADCILRHLAERGGFDGTMRHSAALAWRALALLQEELEAEGAPMSRGSRKESP